MESTILDEFKEKVLNELKFQDEKWGANREKHPLEWQSILIEEVGEVAKEMNDNSFSKSLPETYENELIQVASCVFRMFAQNKIANKGYIKKQF